MKLNRLIFWPLLVALLLLYGGCVTPVNAPYSPAPAGELAAVFFDVGQADSILMGSNGHFMLVDAGNIGQDELLMGYLAEYGVSKLDYLVATHPHADHIGAMAAVIYAMEDIGNLLMPEAIATTKVFERLLDAIEQRNLQITVPEAGESFALGDATVEVLAPLGAEYKDLNDYSIVLRVSLGQVSFLLTGDAEAISESEQLDSSRGLGADVLKVGHHGSASSSTAAYLDAVSPTYAVISCGLDNNYGHPHADTLACLAERNVQVYRTDECGTVEIITDGYNINITCVVP